MRVYNFNEVIGNVSAVSVIMQSLKNGSFPHISIFSGMYGTGKSTCAEIVSLYLTCDNPIDDNPCLMCPQCRASLSALQNTGSSNRVFKINVGRINKKADMEELMRDIFDLKLSDREVVYIIEEAHALDDSQQTALLEEIDRLSSNVYIIFCTTKPTRLLPELRSRAMLFNFTRLNDSEASVLFELQCDKKHITIKDTSIKEMILQYAKGIPRTIVNLMDFICSNDFETQTIADFLGIIDEDSFLLLFESMIDTDLFSMISAIDNLLSKNTRDAIIEQMKSFVLRVLFLEEGGVVEGFNAKELERIHLVFDGHDIIKIAKIIDSLKYNASESELKFKLLQIRQILNNSSTAAIIAENRYKAVQQHKDAEHLREEQENLEQQNTDVDLQLLDIDYLSSL